MVRDFSKDFEGKCCEDDFRTCDWTCAEIQRRIETRAGKGTVYTRPEVDSLLATLTSLYSTLVGSARLFFNTAANIVLFDPTLNSGNFFYATDTMDLYICDGTSWIIVVDYSAFLNATAIDPDDIMLKTVYDTNDDTFIDVDNGGLGTDNSASQGIVTFQAGTTTITENYNPLTLEPAMVADEQLTTSSNPVQVFETSTDYEVILPLLPPTYIWFRIINKTGTNTITVRDDVGGTILIELNTTNGLAADFHWDGNTWNTIALTLV